jgi:predicted dehydrogenase
MTGALQRWAIVGAGTISRSIVADLKLCAGVEAVVVQSRDAGKAAAFAAEFGIPASTSSYLEVLADPDVDVVYLATPFATHHRMTAQALRAGKHVLVEKPMALSGVEVDDLFAIAREQGVFLMEAMWMKFTPGFRRLRAEIDAGTIGEVRSVRSSFGAPFPAGGSRWDLEGSPGALLDQGIYPVTLAHALLGVPDSVSAAGTTRDDGLDLAEHFTLEYSDGRFSQGASSMVEFLDLGAYVNGTRGWIEIPPFFWGVGSLVIHAATNPKLMDEPERVVFDDPGHGYVPMLHEVVAAVGGGALEHPMHTQADTRAVFATMDEIFAQIRG